MQSTTQHTTATPEIIAAAQRARMAVDRVATLQQQLDAARRDAGKALENYRLAAPEVAISDVARASGVHRTTIWEIEIGRAWRRGTLDRIRWALNAIDELRGVDIPTTEVAA
jgi:transcriptional regulator with XRE-family HTH domain